MNRYVCIYVPLYSIVKAEDIKEQNEVSGSKGEASFVWRCKSCKVSDRLSLEYSPLADLHSERVNCDIQESASSIHTCFSTQEAEHYRV